MRRNRINLITIQAVSVAMLLVVASVYEVQDLHAEAEMSYDDINETENEWLDKIDKDVMDLLNEHSAYLTDRKKEPDSCHYNYLIKGRGYNEERVYVVPGSCTVAITDDFADDDPSEDLEPVQYYIFEKKHLFQGNNPYLEKCNFTPENVYFVMCGRKLI